MKIVIPSVHERVCAFGWFGVGITYKKTSISVGDNTESCGTPFVYLLGDEFVPL